ncbi:MAG: DNA polymerase III subunit delta [Limnochordales bacterium]
MGEDAFARERACRLIEEALASGPGGVDRLVLYGDETTPEAIMGAIGTGSLFGDARLVVVRGFDRLGADGQEQLTPLLARLPAGVTVVLVATALDRRRKGVQALIRAGRVVACDPPPRGALPQWVKQRARDLGLRLAPDAVQALLASAGPDPQTLHTELEKLATYAGGAPVDAATVEQVASVAIPYAAEYAVFRFADAVAEGRAQDALVILNDLLAVGHPPLALLGMMARQYRLILLVLDAAADRRELAARLRLQPFVVDRLVRQGALLGQERAAAALRRVIQADKEIKTGRDPRIVLETLVVALAHGQQDRKVG